MRQIAPLSAMAFALFIAVGPTKALSSGDMVALPEPRRDGSVAVEAALAQRRSVRTFVRGAVKLNEVSQLLWAAQGVTVPQRRRTAPSAGALYPLEVYLIASNVATLDAGVYRYIPQRHILERLAVGERINALAAAALGQSWIADAACVLVLAGDFDRTAVKYGKRAERYVHMETGHAAQNVYLQVVALGLGTTMVGAFRDSEVKRLVGMRTTETPLALLPVGRVAE